MQSVPTKQLMNAEIQQRAGALRRIVAAMSREDLEVYAVACRAGLDVSILPPSVAAVAGRDLFNKSFKTNIEAEAARALVNRVTEQVHASVTQTVKAN